MTLTLPAIRRIFYGYLKGTEVAGVPVGLLEQNTIHTCFAHTELCSGSELITLP